MEISSDFIVKLLNDKLVNNKSVKETRLIKRIVRIIECGNSTLKGYLSNGSDKNSQFYKTFEKYSKNQTVGLLKDFHEIYKNPLFDGFENYKILWLFSSFYSLIGIHSKNIAIVLNSNNLKLVEIVEKKSTTLIKDI